MAEDRVMIRVENLTKYYGSSTVPAVDGISFEVRPGEVLGFVGPNGAGKTTTLRILTSYLAPSGGRAEVAGYDVFEQAVQARRRIGYLPEDTPLYKDMSVLEYLEWVARVRQIPPGEVRTRLKRVTDQCAISHRLGSLIGELSKGYRQRVGLAQAILHDPDVLILDEPTGGLDPNQIVEIRNVIKEYGRRKTVIFSTHILPEVQNTCSRVIVISDGKIVADASPSELGSVIEKARGMELVVDFGARADAMRAPLERIPGVASVRPYVQEGDDRAGRLLVTGASGTDLREAIFRAAAAEGAPLLEMSRHAPLEDVFRHLTQLPESGRGAARAAEPPSAAGAA
jgi:ABC-2 type transport system ATP-binding protein